MLTADRHTGQAGRPKGALIRRCATCAAEAPPRRSGRSAAPAPRLCRPRLSLAIYRLAADIIRRSAGRTVTAAAAYRAGLLIFDERTGLSFDYGRRRGIVEAAILAPAYAPAWMRDRARLWNGVEHSEKRKDAQLAREIVLALPHELTHAEHRDLVHRFARAAFVDAGMVADLALHLPGRAGDQRNHHAHILLTMRAIEGESFGPKVRAWNDAALLEQWRALWAGHVNRALELAGEKARVDHRSLTTQGIGRRPQIHLGRAVIEMTARGIATDRGELAGAIERANAATQEPVETQERAKATCAPTAPQRGPQPSNSGGAILTLFRLARALTFRRRHQVQQPRRRRFLMRCRSSPLAGVG